MTQSGYGAAVLPACVRSRMVESGTGLNMHVLEAGFEVSDRPCVVLLHGFPELAYSWRKVMPILATAGFHVIAPDQRGYGRTTGGDGRYDGDVASFHLLNLADDTLGLLTALKVRRAAIVGHDFGSPVAAWCALTRPDVFRSVALLSAPFGGAPRARRAGEPSPRAAIAEGLAALSPPRKHYQSFFSTRAANDDMQNCPQGIHAFLRGYYHCKSADWSENRPFPLTSWAADELAKMPKYYIMDLCKGMAQTVAELEAATEPAPAPAETAAGSAWRAGSTRRAGSEVCAWLPDHELRVYSGEFARTSFQGGLQWYRSATDPKALSRLHAFANRSIDVPCCFIAGKSDWGTYQSPGALEAMSASACTEFRGVHPIEGAGHWVQQEQPAAVSKLLLEFLECRN
jgi:pimeloyl-ACP methyl ester carboxylesterase